MDIETMTDRELDALVAEKVMGWYVKDVVGDHAIGYPPEHYAANAPPMDRQHVPHYSTNAEAAFQAAEKVNLFDEHHLYKDRGGWCVGRLFRDTFDEWSSFWHEDAFASTPARAICLAALKAVE